MLMLALLNARAKARHGDDGESEHLGHVGVALLELRAQGRAVHPDLPGQLAALALRQDVQQRRLACTGETYP